MILILLMLIIFIAALGVWFIYAVGHGGKDSTSDIILLASTAVPIYLCAYGLWWFSRYAESKALEKQASYQDYSSR